MCTRWISFWVVIAALLAPVARASDTVLCTLILRAVDGATILQDGAHCDTRYSPASTFKLPLALIGFDTGHLSAPEAPLIPYDPAINATMQAWRAPTSPRRWLRYSVVWYSQWLTARLGMADFQSHIDALAYGNRDLSGDPAARTACRHAWLSSSLKISPREQLAFLQGLVIRHPARLGPGACADPPDNPVLARRPAAGERQNRHRLGAG